MWFFNSKKTSSNPFHDIQDELDAREETVNFLNSFAISEARREIVDGRFRLFQDTLTGEEELAFMANVKKYGYDAVKAYITKEGTSLATDIEVLVSSVDKTTVVEEGGGDVHLNTLMKMCERYRQYSDNLDAA